MQAKVTPYSPKGLVVQGITAEQAETIRAALGAAVVTSHNARLGGWVFSRKREDRIRELVNGMRENGCPAIYPSGRRCGQTGVHRCVGDQWAGDALSPALSADSDADG